MMPRVKPLIYTPAETLREVRTKTHCHPLGDVKIEAISDTLVEVEASKVVYTWLTQQLEWRSRQWVTAWANWRPRH